MITGLPPFYDEDVNMMFEKIMTADLVLNQPNISADVKHLLRNMLERDPIMRY